MKKLSPYMIIALSYIGLIIIGAILLFLPISHQANQSLNFLDALFTSTSAVTITGLSPVADLSLVLSPFGKTILIILVQIGGLSIVTLSVFVMFLIGAKIGISNRVLIKENLNSNDLSGMVKLVIRIVLFTLAIELIGFIINLFILIPQYDLLTAIGLSAFHAISAFNNAGFDLLGISSTQMYASNILLNLNTAFLIMIGGIGVVVINDIMNKKSYKKLTLHSKIVIFMNLILWVGGMLLFKVSQFNTGTNYTWLESFFLSISARTAGFMTVDLNAMSSLTTLIFIVLMFIGASPASTGGGIKTTTIYTLLKGAGSYAKGKEIVTRKRKISQETRIKAATLLTVAILIIITSTLLLLVFEDLTIDNAFFEIVSAFSNNGVTKGVTQILKSQSKVLLMFVMFIGRVGPLTIISLANRNWYKKDIGNIDYIEEKLMIG